MKNIKLFVITVLFSFLVVMTTGQGNDFKTYSNFDFVAGSQIVFFDNFSNGNIGDFPSLWLSNASGEIVTTSLFDGRWFKMSTNGNFFVENGINVSENFTLEFDMIITREGEHGDAITVSLLETDEEMYPNLRGGGKSGIEIEIVTIDSGLDGHSFRAFDEEKNSSFHGTYLKEDSQLLFNKSYKASIWVQKTRLRMYLDQTKIFDVQRALASGTRVNQLRFTTNYEGFLNITNVRIANADEDSRSKLISDGRLISYGIYFDSGKDIVKPASYGAIKEIATALNENPDVRIIIAGHTDSDGDDKMNLDLSRRRAENVKNALVEEFKIAPSRIETDGKGESEPLAPNNTPENKAKNRRVEFIKI